MKVKFVLTMDNLVVNENEIDQVILNRQTEIEQDELMLLSQKWITSKKRIFLFDEAS